MLKGFVWSIWKPHRERESCGSIPQPPSGGWVHAYHPIRRHGHATFYSYIIIIINIIIYFIIIVVIIIIIIIQGYRRATCTLLNKTQSICYARYHRSVVFWRTSLWTTAFHSSGVSVPSPSLEKRKSAGSRSSRRLAQNASFDAVCDPISLEFLVLYFCYFEARW